MREALTRAWRRVKKSMGAVLGIATVAAIAIGFSGSILFNSATALAPSSVGPVPSVGPAAVRPDAGVRASASPTATACTRTFRGDTTGDDDVTAALQAFVDASPRGSIVCLEPGGNYRMEGKLHLEARDGLTIDGLGARLFATERSSAARILIDRGGSDIQIRNLVIDGYWPEAGTADAVVLAYQGNHGIAIGGAHDVEIGPNVTIRNVGGDGVYITAGAVGGGQRWSDGISVHDSTIERNGRMGVAITDGARNVVVEHNVLDKIALYAFDIEPNAQVFDGVPAGAEHVRFSDNLVGSYGLSPVLVPWLFAGTGKGPQSDVEVSRNVATDGPLRIGVWNVEDTGRTGFRILGNWSDVQVAGPVMEFEGVDGLEVSDTYQPLSFGRLARVTDSRVVGDID